jgi:hypothetical protein
VTAVVSTRCSECHAGLTDPLSRRYGIGPDCRKTMTPAELADALRRNQPGYIPAARPASLEARRNHAEVARVTAPTPKAKRCVHEAIPASCALCRRDNDPYRAAERIIALVKAQREAEREAAYAAWKAAHAPRPEQLAIGATP